MSLHHPLIQSLALPFALAFIWAALARTVGGPETGARWAGAGVALALLVSSVMTIGWVGRPLSITERLPWIVAAAGVLGVVLDAMKASRRLQWLAAGVLWALVVTVVLGNQPMLPRIGSWIVGMAVIGAIVAEPTARAHGAAMLVVAGLGLAALAMRSGSALLFELALALAAAVAAVGLWLWPVSRIRLGASAVVAAVIVWLSLAQSTGLLTGSPPGAVLLLAATFSSGAVVRGLQRRLRRVDRPEWVVTLMVAGVAVLWVLAALALAHWGGKAFGADPRDPYYAPNWK